jgi:hypothetical protein
VFLVFDAASPLQERKVSQMFAIVGFVLIGLLIRHMDRDWYDDETGRALETREHDIKQRTRRLRRFQ